MTTFSQTLDSLNLNSDAVLANQAVRLSQISSLETSLQGYADQVKSDLLGNAPIEALNTLQEIATALGNDDDLAGTITTNIATTKSELEAADTALGERITSEVTIQNQALSDESTARSTAVSTLTTNIATTKSELEAADTALDDRIDTEAASRAQDVNWLTDSKISKNNGTSTGVLATENIAVGAHSYIYIGERWRIKANDNGSQLIFEYAALGVGPETMDALWEVAIPFITTPAS